MDSEEIILLLIVLLVVFLFLREINCWYWKINALLQACEKTNEKLDTLVRIFETNAQSSSTPETPPADSPPNPPPSPELEESSDVLDCPECGKTIPIAELIIDNGFTKCPYCRGYFEVEQV